MTSLRETVLISGGNGFVGTRLTNLLLQEGFNVTHLSRNIKGDETVKTYRWDTINGYIEEGAVETADYIIHLAGANIAEKPWTKKRKKIIIDSRINTAEMLYNQTKGKTKPLKAFVSASAIGYYGAVTTDHIFTESDPPGSDFTAQTCVLWENAANKFEAIGIRTVKIRTAIVMGPNGGALSKMAKPVNFWMGSALGSGKQFFPWIHLDDLSRIYIKAIVDSSMNGAYNAVAPHHVTNGEFMKTLANVLGKPFFMPNVPAFIIKLMFGEMGNAILEGSRISSKKVIEAGFKFKFLELNQALKAALK